MTCRKCRSKMFRTSGVPFCPRCDEAITWEDCMARLERLSRQEQDLFPHQRVKHSDDSVDDIPLISELVM